MCSVQQQHVSNSTSLCLTRGPFLTPKCKVKSIYIIFSLTASPDVWKLGCSINYWNLNILHVLLRNACMIYSYLSGFWHIYRLISHGPWMLSIIQTHTWLTRGEYRGNERGVTWRELALICLNNKQVRLHMNYLEPLFGKHTVRCNDRWQSQCRSIHPGYTGNHERRVPQDTVLSDWWTR